MNSHQIVLPQVELQYSILDGGKYKTNILRILLKDYFPCTILSNGKSQNKLSQVIFLQCRLHDSILDSAKHKFDVLSICSNGEVRIATSIRIRILLQIHF